MNAPLVRRSPAHRGQVVAVADLTPRMRRVTVRSASMVDLEVTPTQDVELLLREEGGRRVKRRYTIRTARPDEGELDLDVLLHGHGPGSSWGATAQVGDEIEFQGPRGKLELRPAPFHLLVGDESALPAIAALAEALPAGEDALALVEVDSAADHLPPACEVRWVHRDGAAPGTPELLGVALAEVSVPPEARGYLMGESRSMIALREIVEGLGIAHEAMFVKGYWNLGRPDRLSGRSPGTA